MFKRMMVAIAVLPSAALAGSISKFDHRPPVADYDSGASMGDIERCLIDMSNAGQPFVYSQADRPDDVTFIWNPGVDAQTTRVDLHRVSAGTHVRSWSPYKQVRDCAPEK